MIPENERDRLGKLGAFLLDNYVIYFSKNDGGLYGKNNKGKY